MRISLAILALVSGVVFVSAAEPTNKAPRRNIFDAILRRDSASTNALGSLSTAQLNDGLKQALDKGLQTAVTMLGRTNGFLTNAQVRIPFPSQLAAAERTLRKLKQDALVDEFETALNRAAEKAVPAASQVFVGAVKELTLENAARLLSSKSPDAITEYFREKTSSELFTKFLPIVKEATGAVGVTAAYNKLLASTATGRFSFLGKSGLNIDEYVTQRAMDGLFKMVADEEKRIRENPQARTTELLEKVFGAIQKPGS